MSSHVYIAYEGFKETPIERDAWLQAARQCDELFVEEKKNRFGEIHHTVALKGNKWDWLHLNPYGVVDAQDPSKELVLVMFKLASILDAGVYSERLKRYASVEDWERRTKKYRQSLAERREAYRKKRRIRAALWALLIVVSAIIGWNFKRIINAI